MVCALVWTLLAVMDTFSRRCGYWHLRLFLGGVFGGRLHAHVGACWAAVFNGCCGRTWALVGGSVACVLHECACGSLWAQLTFGCLDVAVISTRVNHVGMFLRGAEPASTLGRFGIWVFFFCVFPVFSRGFKFFSGGQKAPTSQGPT